MTLYLSFPRLKYDAMKRTPISESKSTKFSGHIQVSDSGIDLEFFFRQTSLRVEGWEDMGGEGIITLYVSSNSGEATCPYCGHQSDRIHSRYIRTLCDLPAFGKEIHLRFHARRFFCLNDECRKKTFAEQPGNEIFRYRRRTRRCEVCVHRHALCMPSQQCSTVLKGSGINVSGSTVLRDLHRMAIPDSREVRRIGIDDWSFRKGKDYGSLIVDLASGRPIDMLADRSEHAFSEWLAGHGSVWLLSRDRATAYSSAARSSGLPITEIADRFHLMKNLGECVSDTIKARYDDICAALRAEGGHGESPKSVGDRRQAYARQRLNEVKRLQAEGKGVSETRYLLGMSARTVKKYREMEPGAELKGASRKKAYAYEVRFNEVKRLQDEGKSVVQTMSVLGMTRKTVEKYRSLDSFPIPVRRTAPGLGPYTRCVEEQYARGVSLNQIYRELRGKGLVISRARFYAHFDYLPDGHRGYRPAVQKARMEEECRQGAGSPVHGTMAEMPPVRQVINTVMRSVVGRELTESETSLMSVLRKLDWIVELYDAAHSFREILRSGCPARLDAWMGKYRESGISRLQQFINGISRDSKAVRNAVLFKESNGILEGYVNKLKTIKRSMYGRAKLNLLRIKMVMPAFTFN